MERQRRFLTGWRLDAAREMHAFQLANLLAAEAVQRPSLARRLALLDVLQPAGGRVDGSSRGAPGERMLGPFTQKSLA